MATTFESGELTLALTEQALGDALEVNWLLVRSLKGAQMISIGATGVAVGSDYVLLGGESQLLPACNLAEVFAIGLSINDKLFYAYASGTSTGGITVVQGTAVNLQVEPNQATPGDLQMTNTPAGWTPTAELGVATNVVKASAGILHSFLIETNGVNNAVVQAYNHASNATNPITPSIVVAGGDRYGGSGPIDVVCSNGIVIVVSGTNAVVTAYFL